MSPARYDPEALPEWTPMALWVDHIRPSDVPDLVEGVWRYREARESLDNWWRHMSWIARWRWYHAFVRRP